VQRPLGAYFLFSNDVRGKVKAEHPDWKITEVAKHLGELWAKASDKDKEKYQKKADEVSTFLGTGRGVFGRGTVGWAAGETLMYVLSKPANQLECGLAASAAPMLFDPALLVWHSTSMEASTACACHARALVKLVY
jgi:hypothetical protein